MIRGSKSSVCCVHLKQEGSLPKFTRLETKKNYLFEMKTFYLLAAVFAVVIASTLVRHFYKICFYLKKTWKLSLFSITGRTIRRAYCQIQEDRWGMQSNRKCFRQRCGTYVCQRTTNRNKRKVSFGMCSWKNGTCE